MALTASAAQSGGFRSAGSARGAICATGGGRCVGAVAASAAPTATPRAAFKAAVREGRPLFGVFLDAASPLAAEQLGHHGFDWLLADVQHAPTDYATLAAMLTAVNASGTPALVRVEGPGDRAGIQQALDLGAAGVMVPTVETAADVQRVVAACYYPDDRHPTGTRSISWPIRPQLGRDVAEYLRQANDEVVVIVQVETRPCFQQLEEVLAVPGVDCCFCGPVDLSHALGLAQRHGFPACFDTPEFAACLDRVASVCKASGVTPGNFALTEAQAQAMLERGFTLLATGTDVGFMADAAARNAAMVGRLRAAA